MTIAELITYEQKMYPDQYGSDLHLAWVNEVEKEISDYLWLFDKDTEFEPHTDTTEELLIDEPEIYSMYLGAKADFCNGEFGRYNNKVLQFNTAFDDWKARYIRRNEPSFGEEYIKI